MKVAINSFTGNASKTTLAAALAAILGAKRIAVETVNAGDGVPDVQVAAHQFKVVAAQLNALDRDEHVVLDIGASNAEAMISQFAALRSTRDDIDFWIVPVPRNVKQHADTKSTVFALKKIKVAPERILIVATQVQDLLAFDADFGSIADFAAEQGCTFVPVPMLYSDVYDLLKGDKRSVIEVADHPFDVNAAKAACQGDPKKLEAHGQAVVIQDLALDAAENLRELFAATPILADAGISA